MIRGISKREVNFYEYLVPFEKERGKKYKIFE